MSNMSMSIVNYKVYYLLLFYTCIMLLSNNWSDLCCCFLACLFKLATGNKHQVSPQFPIFEFHMLKQNLTFCLNNVKVKMCTWSWHTCITRFSWQVKLFIFLMVVQNYIGENIMFLQNTLKVFLFKYENKSVASLECFSGWSSFLYLLINRT